MSLEQLFDRFFLILKQIQEAHDIDVLWIEGNVTAYEELIDIAQAIGEKEIAADLWQRITGGDNA